MFKQRSNKTFQYKNRFLKEDLQNTDVNNKVDTKEFVSKWKRESKPKLKSAMSMPILIFVLVLLLVVMYLLEKKYM